MGGASDEKREGECATTDARPTVGQVRMPGHGELQDVLGHPEPVVVEHADVAHAGVDEVWAGDTRSERAGGVLPHGERRAFLTGKMTVAPRPHIPQRDCSVGGLR